MTLQDLEKKVVALEGEVKSLKKKQINVIMTNNDDVNAYRAVQRALQGNSLTIGGGNNTIPQESAILSLNSRTKGFLPPRTNIVEQIQPAEGMMVYNYDHEALEVYNGQQWGFTFPRLTSTQMNALSSPLDGMAVYNMTLDTVLTHNGSAWGMYLPSYTTTERDALTPTEGMIIFNDTTNKINFYTGAAWEAVTSA